MSKKNIIINDSNFYDLMSYRIHEILLVASQYDAFILEQDGKLTEQIMNEYMGMNLSYAPRVWNAPSANDAMELLNKKSFDLIIIMMRLSDMNSVRLGRKIKTNFPKKPTVLLAFDESEIKRISLKQKKYFDEIFIWSGDSNVFPAIMKCIEDKKNISRDIKKGDIRLIIVVEDTPKYYSTILPVLYKEIIYNTKQLIDKSLNDVQRLFHMRGRPKIILTTNYEDAISIFKKYQKNTLGIITDLQFPINNVKSANAGIELISEIRKSDSTIPILLQTTFDVKKNIIDKYAIKYINKNSTKLFKELKEFMINNFGFGIFEFRLPNGRVIGKAADLIQLKNKLKSVNKDSLLFHASNNHLSNWLAARGELQLSSKFRKIKIEDFDNTEDRRKYYLKLLDESIINRKKESIVEFSNVKKDYSHNFIRIGKGSLGGKARGLAFADSIIINNNFNKKFQNLNVKIPKTFVITTSEFDEFMDSNKLWDFALSSSKNDLIERKFLNANLPKSLKKILKKLLKNLSTPIAIRSSGLLEDSQYKPLAGMYSTFMLPNSHKSFNERYNQLSESIKRIYASVFFKEPKSLMDSISQRYEEEKMAIIIMELIGKNNDNIFYPTISGVCQSYNYYPVSHMDRKDGITFLALGLGKTIADGGKSLRYCPKYPNIISQNYSTKASINNSQNKFYALKLNNGLNPMKKGEENNLQIFDLEVAEKHNELKFIASVISNQDNIKRESLNYKGPRILTFSSIIKYSKNELNEILKFIMKEGEKLIGCPIEIEFAMNLHNNKIDEFYLLQIKPMTIENFDDDINIKKIKDTKSSLCYSKNVLGDGIFQKIKHIVYVDPKKFKRESTMEIASEIGYCNNLLGNKNPYLLIGPGRWGTMDSWLGIPVNWEQISNAKTIVEIGIESLNPDPSFGSHFFQNITSLRIGYFTLEKKLQDKNIDWEWLKNQNHMHSSEYVNIIELEQPLTIKIDGIKGDGVIIKPKTDTDSMDENESSGI